MCVVEELNTSRVSFPVRHLPRSHSSLFRLDKIMNCNLASAALLIPDTHTHVHICTHPHTHTHTCPVVHLCVSLLTWMFGVTVDFKLHFLCLQLLRPALSPELHEDRIDTVSAVKKNNNNQCVFLPRTSVRFSIFMYD